MYELLLFLHSITRWLVFGGLLFAIYRAYKGYRSKAIFTKRDDLIRHLTATFAHVQLVIGILLYIKSPLMQYFWTDHETASEIPEVFFFGWIHSSMMLVAVIVITLGSSLAKRKTTDRQKFKTMLVWFIIALLIIFIAIPWPFSPLAQRAYFRTL